jgi:hypothetical protein
MVNDKDIEGILGYAAQSGNTISANPIFHVGLMHKFSRKAKVAGLNGTYYFGCSGLYR